MLQRADEFIAAGCFRHCLHLGICGGQSSHTNIFPDSFIKQKIVLGDKSYLIVELREGNFL